MLYVPKHSVNAVKWADVSVWSACNSVWCITRNREVAEVATDAKLWVKPAWLALTLLHLRKKKKWLLWLYHCCILICSGREAYGEPLEKGMFWACAWISSKKLAQDSSDIVVGKLNSGKRISRSIAACKAFVQLLTYLGMPLLSGLK